MYSLIKLLENIGLTEKESKSYLISLKIGTNPASILAKHTDCNRGTMYTILESLVNKGLIIQFEKNNIRYFTAVEPRCLLTYIDDKKRVLTNYKSALDQKIPELESLKNPFQLIPNVKSYIGQDGLNKIFSQVIKEARLWILAAPSKGKDRFFSKYIHLFLRKNPSINLIISDENGFQRHHITSPSELEVLSPIKPLQCIGQDRVYIISTAENYGVEIENSDIVSQFTVQFEYTWRNRSSTITRKPPTT